MSCIKISKTNKAESNLFNTIYNEVANQNEQLATMHYNWFNGKEFKHLFGFNYVDEYHKNIKEENTEYFNNGRVDENGEPKLFLEKESNKYYFLDKNNLKVYFPFVSKGLSGYFTQEEIKNIVSRLTASYIKRHLGISFNNIDFSKKMNFPVLEEFIKKSITKKITQLEEEGDLVNSLNVEILLEHIYELHQLVGEKFVSIGLQVTEHDVDNFSDEESDETATREEQYGKASFDKSSKDKISTDVKMRLSLLSDPNKKDSIWNDNILIDFNTVYGKLQEILGNTIPAENEYLFDTYLNIIEENAVYFPYLKELHELLLNNNNESFKNQFTQAFYLGKNVFVNEKYKKYEDSYIQNTIDLSNSIDKLSNIKSNWSQSFKKLKYNHFTDLIKTFKNIVEKAPLKEKTTAEIDKYKYNVKTILHNIGIELSDDAFNYYLSGVKNDELFNVIHNLATQLNSYILPNIGNKSKDLFSLSNELNKLVRAQAFTDSNLYDPNLRIAGKKRWLYSNPSHLHMQLERWKKNPEILLKEYYDDVYLQDSSKWIKEWFELDRTNEVGEPLTFDEYVEFGRKNLANVKLGILGEITYSEKDKKDVYSKTTDLSFKDYFLNNLNSVLKKEGFVRTVTQADKSTEFTFKTLINRIKSFIQRTPNNTFIINDDVKQIYFNYYLSEIKRMLQAKQEVIEASNNKDIKLTPHYHYNYKDSLKNPKTIYQFTGNAFKSQYFNFLNPGEAKTTLEKQIVNLLYEGKNLKIDSLDNKLIETLQPLFNEYFDESSSKNINDIVSKMISLKLIEVTSTGYVNKLIDTKLFNSYVQSNTPIGIRDAIYNIAADYFLNGVSNNIEYSKLFTGDVAYYKDAVDFKKRVPATYTDGQYLILKPGESDFKIATINAVSINSPFLDELKAAEVDEDTIKMLTDINSTDAQAWITPERWKFLKQKLGQWSKVHDEVYKKMQSNKPETFSKEELKAAAQPLKGVYFYKQNGKPTYLKYSQAVLSNQLIKGTPLERVLKSMKDNEVDELITFDGVKVGAIEPTTIHNEDGSIKDIIELNVQTLNNHGWKLQQDLPTKNFKLTDVGSQIQKNIFAGIKHYLEDNNFTFRNKKITGKELNELLVKTVGALSDIGYKKLIGKAGIDKDGNIINFDKFYKLLISELKERNGSENIIKALEAHTVLFGIPQSTNKLFQIFASMINNNIIKIKTNGGSFIQMADFGLSFENVNNDKSGIRLNPNVEKFSPPLLHTNEDGSKSVTPGAIFIPASFIAKYIPDWKKYDNKELFVSYRGGAPIISKKLQETIIGYRIPNQGLPSNDSLQIAGILPESAGDTIVAYTGITSKTGSDFDKN